MEVTSGNFVKPILTAASVSHALASDSDVTLHINCYGHQHPDGSTGAGDGHTGYSRAGGGNFLDSDLYHGMNFTVAELLAGIDLNAEDSVNAPAYDASPISGSLPYHGSWILRVIAFNNTGVAMGVGCFTQVQPWSEGPTLPASCTTPEASYTDLAISQLTTTGCYRKPILTATSVSHSIGSDTNLRFWVNCKLGNDTSSTFGAAACSSGGNLVAGKLFTYSQLQAGIDLLASDSTNAAAQEVGDGSPVGWDVRVTAVDISACSTSICADTGGDIQNLSQDESFPYGGPALYTGSGTFPQFQTFDSVTTSAGMGSSSTYVLQVGANVEYFADSSSLGDDTFGSTAFKIEIQYDTSCDTSGGCGSYSWTNGIDNDTFLAAGTGGAGYEQTFDVVEADCWNEDYLFVRYRIVSQSTCGASLAGQWTTSSLGEFDVSSAGAQCGGGGP